MVEVEKIVQAPASSGDPTKTLEMAKETNRHDEEMAKLGLDRDYKIGMVDAVGGIVDNVGAGIAKEIMRSKPVPGAAGANTEAFNCAKCGNLVTGPKGAIQLKCASCGAIYVDKDRVPPQAPPPAAPPPQAPPPPAVEEAGSDMPI